MDSFQGSAAGLSGSVPNPRVRYRHAVSSLVYVTLDQGNGAIILNMSDQGLAIQAVAPLHAHQSLRLRFDLFSPKTRVDARAEVAWCDNAGRAGLRFLDLSPQSRRQLNDWIFLSLMRRLEETFPVLRAAPGREDFILSRSVRQSFRLPQAAEEENDEDTPSDKMLPFWRRPISARTLARLMDGLILFCAVLMFLFVFLLVARGLPAWPITLGLAIGVCGFFAALYRYLFAMIGCGTAGVHWARIAIEENDPGTLAREEQTRFR